MVRTLSFFFLHLSATALEIFADIDSIFNELGDFNYPILDASREDQRRRMREEEDGIIHNHKRVKGKGRQTLLAQPTPQHRSSYGRLAESSSSSEPSGSNGESSRAAHPEPEGAGVLRAARTFVKDVLGGSDSEEEAEILQRREQEEKSRLPSDAIDLMVVDEAAEDEEMVRSRRKGEPAGKVSRSVFCLVCDAL